MTAAATGNYCSRACAHAAAPLDSLMGSATQAARQSAVETSAARVFAIRCGPKRERSGSDGSDPPAAKRAMIESIIKTAAERVPVAPGTPIGLDLLPAEELASIVTMLALFKRNPALDLGDAVDTLLPLIADRRRVYGRKLEGRPRTDKWADDLAVSTAFPPDRIREMIQAQHGGALVVGDIYPSEEERGVWVVVSDGASDAGTVAETPYELFPLDRKLTEEDWVPTPIAEFPLTRDPSRVTIPRVTWMDGFTDPKNEIFVLPKENLGVLSAGGEAGIFDESRGYEDDGPMGSYPIEGVHFSGELRKELIAMAEKLVETPGLYLMTIKNEALSGGDEEGYAVHALTIDTESLVQPDDDDYPGNEERAYKALARHISEAPQFYDDDDLNAHVQRNPGARDYLDDLQSISVWVDVAGPLSAAGRMLADETIARVWGA
jgi:hypothetical protein